MTSISTLTFVWYLAVASFELWLILRLAKAYRPAHVPPSDSGHYPRALAVLCLRGADPRLRECLRRLADQDYPDYRLRIVIDSETDPVVSDVRAFLDTHPRVRVEIRYLGRREPHCSGKVAGILRATQDLPADVQVVAVFDADALLHRSCLRELVAPLADERIGVTYGNRWYVPSVAELSPLIRSAWNGHALAAMTFFGIPWGGCMALGAAHVRDPEYRACLKHAFCEDGATPKYMWKRGLKLRFVSEATIVNCEGVTFGALYNFLIRQYLVVRVDHPKWLFIALHNLILTGTIASGFVLPFLVELAAASHCAFAGLVGVATALPLVARRFVERSLAKRHVEIGALGWRKLLLLPVCALATSATTFSSTLHAVFVRRHRWRGVTYGFGRRHPVTVLQVDPVPGALDPAMIGPVAASIMAARYADDPSALSNEVPAPSAAEIHAPRPLAGHRASSAIGDRPRSPPGA